jgi:hypothetical protein
VGPFELASTHKAAEALKHGERKVITFFLKSAPDSIFDNYDFPLQVCKIEADHGSAASTRKE